jgi:hypothetical protein
LLRGGGDGWKLIDPRDPVPGSPEKWRVAGRRRGFLLEAAERRTRSRAQVTLIHINEACGTIRHALFF